MKTQPHPARSAWGLGSFTLILTFCFALALTCLHAQSPQSTAPADASLQAAMAGNAVSSAALQQVISNALPPAYVIYAPFITLALMLLGRSLKSWLDGHGLGQWLSGLFCGTNSPTKLPLIVGGICLLSLSSCTGVTAFLASPIGQAAVASAASLGKQLAKAVAETEVAQVITTATASLAALQAQGVNNDTAKEIARQGEMAALQTVISAAQAQYVGMTGDPYVIPVTPAPAVPAAKPATTPAPATGTPLAHRDDIPGCMQLYAVSMR